MLRFEPFAVGMMQECRMALKTLSINYGSVLAEWGCQAISHNWCLTGSASENNPDCPWHCLLVLLLERPLGARKIKKKNSLK